MERDDVRLGVPTVRVTVIVREFVSFSGLRECDSEKVDETNGVMEADSVGSSVAVLLVSEGDELVDALPEREREYEGVVEPVLEGKNVKVPSERDGLRDNVGDDVRDIECDAVGLGEVVFEMVALELRVRSKVSELVLDKDCSLVSDAREIVGDAVRESEASRVTDRDSDLLIVLVGSTDVVFDMLPVRVTDVSLDALLDLDSVTSLVAVKLLELLFS